MAQEHARNAAEAVIYAMLIRLLGQRSRRAVRLLASCAMELANASNAMGLAWWKSESVITVSVSRCLFESATPFRLKIVQITSERCRTLGQVYSHLSEEERQIIQIEIGNGTSIRRIAGLIGRHASTVSYEIKRNTWFPSSEKRILPAVPAGASQDGAVDRPVLHRRPRAPEGRTSPHQDPQAVPARLRPPVGVGGRTAT